jgi:hypothetical protein
MAMLQERHAECVAGLDRERMAVEVVFRTKEPDGTEHLWWFSLKGDQGADHEAQARRTKERGWMEAEPQVVFLPERVRGAVEAWAVRATDPA